MATEARPQAQAEKLTLLVADNKTGFFCVYLKPGLSKPYTAQVRRGGNQVYLGNFATAEEAALCVARSSEGRAVAAERAAAAPQLTSEEARQQAQAEKLTLLVAENKAGYFGVTLSKPGQPKPYKAQVRRGGKDVSLGSFATAEEAALCVARTPEGQAAAAERRAAAAAPLTSEEARQQAQAEKLTLLVAENKTGYFGVNLGKPGRSKPYLARVKRGGKDAYLGVFATAEEAALCVARTPEGRAAAAERAAAAAPLRSEEARQQAQAEKLTLLRADNSSGYFGVHLNPGRPKPYLARVKRGGKNEYLGHFATAEEAALCVARSPEGRAAAGRAAAGGSQNTLPAVPSGSSLKEEGTVPPMPPGAFVKGEGVVPPMPPDAFVKVEVVVKEEEGSGQPKRQRTK
jgi:myo-inositol-hexaphosphate 3-phosphohydrolase